MGKNLLDFLFLFSSLSTLFYSKMAFVIPFLFIIYLYLRQKSEEQEKQDFISFASHELKSYLTIIQGYSEALLDPQLPPEKTVNCIKQVLSSSKKLNAIINAILQLEKKRLAKESVLIEDLLNTIKTEFKLRFPKNVINIEKRYHQKKVRIHFDLFLLAIFNLLDNAVKHGSGHVSLIVTSTKNGIAFTVEDTGKGIILNKLSKLFKRNYSLNPTKGSGLGLYLVQKIIDHHQAKIRACSQRKGTSFTIDVTN